MSEGKCRRCKGKKIIAVGGGSDGYHHVVNWEKCPQCNGTGKESKRESVSIRKLSDFPEPLIKPERDILAGRTKGET